MMLPFPPTAPAKPVKRLLCGPGNGVPGGGRGWPLPIGWSGDSEACEPFTVVRKIGCLAPPPRPVRFAMAFQLQLRAALVAAAVAARMFLRWFGCWRTEAVLSALIVERSEFVRVGTSALPRRGASED